MFPRRRAFWRASVLVCALFASACHGSDNKAQTPLLRTAYGVFDPALQRLTDIATPVAVRHDHRRLKIVQFIGPVQPKWRRLLLDRGVTIRGYMHEHAFIVEATDDDARALGKLPMVRAVVDEPRLWRIDPRLIQWSEQGPAVRRDLGAVDVAIELANAGVRDDVAEMIRFMHATLQNDVTAQIPGRVLHARLTAGQIDALAADSDVSAVEPFDPVHPTDDLHNVVGQPVATREDEVWSHGLRGQQQLVATCDVGVFTNACWFGGDKIADYSHVTASVEHDHDHGTRVAAVIAGDRNDNGLFESFDGTAPAAQLFIQDAGNARAGDMSVPLDLGALFAPAYDAGARIESNAWTGEVDSYGSRERSLDAFCASHRDFLVVSAAGNAGDAPATVGSPATAKNVITVGALSAAAPEDVSSFSAAGPTGDNRIKPTLVAPGEGIVSANAKSVCVADPVSGTSMAASNVAGAAALVRQYYEEGFYPEGAPNHARSMAPSAALVKATLLAGADDMQGEGTGGNFPVSGQGFGRVHLDNALIFGDASRHLFVRDDQEGLEQAETFTVPVEVRDGALHVALVWTDEPAVAGAAVALVNDLDLEVTAPDGTRYFGNQLDGGESAPTRGGDHTNVEEILYFARATPGRYLLTVRAFNVPMAPQPYALVVSGNLAGLPR